MLIKKRGQSTLEYALVVAAVAAALVGINAYMQKGVQGKLKESTDQIGRQFDPDDYTSAWKTQSAGQTSTIETRAHGGDGSTTSETRVSETITKSEYEDFGATPGHHYGDADRLVP